MDASPHTNDAFTVGFIAGFTGPYGTIAENQFKGAALAVAEVNEAGGVGGKEVVLLKRDDQMDSARGRTIAKELIAKDGVDVLAGTISAATQLSINEVAKRHNVPFVSCSQSNSIGTAEHKGPYTFHEGLTPYMTGLQSVRWGVENLGKRWVFLIPEYQWGYESYEASKEILSEEGGEEVKMLSVPFGGSVEDYRRTFPEILAAKPDVLSVRNLGQDQINFVKAAAMEGLKKEVPIFIGISEIELLNHVTLEEVVGMYWGVNFYWGLEDRIDSAKRFVSAFRKSFDGELPTGYAGYAYAGVKEFLIAANESGTVFDPEKMRLFLEGRFYDHYKGPQWWRPCDHQSFQDFYVLRFKGPEESAHKDDIAEIIGTVSWDLSTERSCEEMGYDRGA